MNITHRLPSALIASFPSPEEQAQWLAANPTHQLMGRIIRPQSAKGETFAVLVEHVTLEQCAAAQLADIRAQQAARKAYLGSLKTPENKIRAARGRFERKWGARTL